MPNEVVEPPTDERRWTPEQVEAISRRGGGLFLDAAAGSGKTSVLVERFVRAVLEDGVDVRAILTITFTDRSAAEMRERIRARLRELGAVEAGRATERAFISTIDAFCARLLRTHALAAGIDPRFTVLDAGQAALLAGEAFEEALEALAQHEPGGPELIASYATRELRAATLGAYWQLRSRGERHPRLPEVPPVPDLESLRERVSLTAGAVLAELAAVASASDRVLDAIGRLERVDALQAAPVPWPSALDPLALPGGNGAALRSEACLEYTHALADLRAGCAHWHAIAVRDGLDRLLQRFLTAYERRKRERSGVDFADLELLCLELLRSRPELRERYRERFTRVMVDEMQDTNPVQLELIEAISRDNLFTVGDAQQSIYGFRHADVELFRRRGREMELRGDRATLQANFRSRPQIVEVINRVFAQALGDDFRPLVAGREESGGEDAGGQAPLVELLVVDRSAETATGVQPSISWRVAEARLLADRVAGLIADGAAPRDVVVLTRATTDLRTYEKALEERRVPTYVIGGRGYWSHPQVIDALAYLRMLANPRDEEALYTVLVSPLAGISYDGLVLIGAAAREAGRDPWWVLREPGELLGELAEEDRVRAVRFAAWADGERRLAARRGVEELIERMLEHTGYDLAVLSMPDGQRRLANVRKLMRLGREHLAGSGPDLRGFLELVADRSRGAGGEEESEAPVEGEALDAVRMMTIHRAKGLEFKIVCVADLGRAPRHGGEVVRIGSDRRLGLRLGRPGTGPREPALDHKALGEEQRVAEAGEERRLFYVAATRARERLIFSGAAELSAVWEEGRGTAPITWLGPALVPGLPAGEGMADGVRFVVRGVGEERAEGHREARVRGRAGLLAGLASQPAPPGVRPGEGVERGVQPRALSYTSLTSYRRCGYRFYVERVLGLPAADAAAAGRGSARALSATERGTIVHALLERLDLRRPVTPGADAIALAAGRRLPAGEGAEIGALIERFSASELWARIGRATTVRREQSFGFELGGVLITGVLDAIAIEPGGRALVVDYKTDRLEDREPPAVVEAGYAIQRLVYAVAALRDGACEVEVAHVFLERPDEPVVAAYRHQELAALERQLESLVAGVSEGRFAVADEPHRELCQGCPAEGGLCSWPLSATRRDSPERLF